MAWKQAVFAVLASPQSATLQAEVRARERSVGRNGQGRLGGATEGAARAALQAFFGPAVELTAWGADAVRWLRFKTQVKILQRATQLLADVGLAPDYVPAKTLVPLLELASLEDPEDEEMHTRWAALLANASAGDAANGEVLPSFPQILSELTSIEATMLERLARDDDRGHQGIDLNYFGDEFGFPTPMMGDPPRDPIFNVYIDNLERLQLCIVDRPDTRVAELEKQLGVRPRGIVWPYPRIRLSDLGTAFVAACTPPGDKEIE